MAQEEPHWLKLLARGAWGGVKAGARTVAWPFKAFWRVEKLARQRWYYNVPWRLLHTAVLVAALQHGVPAFYNYYAAVREHEQAMQTREALGVPRSMKEIVGRSYTPYTKALLHYLIPSLVKDYENQLAREYTGMENASQLINNKINALVSEYKQNPRYKRASEYIDNELVNAIILGESRFRPWISRISLERKGDVLKVKPAVANGETMDNGLGQVTRQALEQCKKDGFLKGIKLSKLRTLLPRSAFEASLKRLKSEYEWYKSLGYKKIDVSAFRELYERERQELKQELEEKEGRRVSERELDEHLIKENEQRISRNLRATVHTLFYNAEEFLKHIEGKENPLLNKERFVAISYRKGGAGTAGLYLSSVLSERERRAAKTMKWRRELVSKATRFTRPALKPWRMPITVTGAAGALPLLPLVPPAVRWVRERKGKRLSGKKRGRKR